MKIFVGLGTNLFANLRIYIFLFYVVTVVFFLAIGYYVLEALTLQEPWLFAIALLSVVILSGVFISKLALDPLIAYVQNLQNLSKETLHELNLPISTITTNVQMLQKKSSDAKEQKRLARIESACSMLQERYNELDYLIKMQTKQELKESFFLDELVMQRVEFLQHLYPHIKFHLSLQHTMVEVDKVGLAKVIDNIIDNGVKYSQNSQDIEIEFQDGVLSIRDFGIGIDEVQLVHIFDNFYQTDNHAQGFGIGLAMVKRYCDKQGVVLLVKSQPNKGTTVSLNFTKQIGK